MMISYVFQRILLLIVVLFVCNCRTAQVAETVFGEDVVLVDSIVAIVIADNGVELITKSDLERPNFFGKLNSLDEAVFECCLYLDALKHHIVITEEQIDRQLETVMRENNLTLDGLKRLCVEFGITYQDLRDKLARLFCINSIVDHKINGYVIINRSDVIAYYEANPEYTEAVYYLQRAVVPYQEDRDVQRTTLASLGKETQSEIEWGVVFSIDHSAVAPKKSFIHTMQLGDVILSDELYNGFELYRLVEKKEPTVRPLDERYLTIDGLLRQPLYEKLYKEYKEQLINKATIIYV